VTAKKGSLYLHQFTLSCPFGTVIYWWLAFGGLCGSIIVQLVSAIGSGFWLYYGSDSSKLGDYNEWEHNYANINTSKDELTDIFDTLDQSGSSDIFTRFKPSHSDDDIFKRFKPSRNDEEPSEISEIERMLLHKGKQ